MSWDIGGFGSIAAKDGGYGFLIVGAASSIGKAAAEFLGNCGAAAVIRTPLSGGRATYRVLRGSLS